MKRLIKDMIQFMVILISIDLVWSGLEILFDRGVTNTISDSVMGFALAYMIKLRIDDYKLNKLILRNLKIISREINEDKVDMEDKNKWID